MRYQFLLFDLDNTLLDFGKDEAMAFERLYREMGWEASRSYSPEMLALYSRCNIKWWHIFEKGECSKNELFLNRFRDFLAGSGLTGDPETVNEAYFHFLGEGGAAFPGALEMVERLGKKAQIYVITNGNAPTARSRISRSGLLPLIRGYFVSETIGAAKPDRAYFDHVAESIPGFDPKRAVVIGDSPHSDLLGAANAGLDSVWYCPAGGDNGGVPYTFRAESFEEIVQILEAG